MSAVPCYAISTACRTAESPHSPLRIKKQTAAMPAPNPAVLKLQGRTRTQSASEGSGAAVATSGKPSLTPAINDLRTRSSSLNHLDRCQKDRERVMNILSSTTFT